MINYIKSVNTSGLLFRFNKVITILWNFNIILLNKNRHLKIKIYICID